VMGFKKCCISSAVDGTDDDMWWNVRSEWTKIKALTVNM